MAAKCKICKKSVYPMDPQINLDGSIFHKPCAKCADCNCQITLSNFTKNESSDQTLLLCKIHYFKRFHEGGSYVGGDKYQKTATRDGAPERRPSYVPKVADTTAASSTASKKTSVESVFPKLSISENEPAAPAEDAVTIKDEEVPVIATSAVEPATVETADSNSKQDVAVDVSAPEVDDIITTNEPEVAAENDEPVTVNEEELEA